MKYLFFHRIRINKHHGRVVYRKNVISYRPHLMAAYKLREVSQSLSATWGNSLDEMQCDAKKAGDMNVAACRPDNANNTFMQKVRGCACKYKHTHGIDLIIFFSYSFHHSMDHSFSFILLFA